VTSRQVLDKCGWLATLLFFLCLAQPGAAGQEDSEPWLQQRLEQFQDLKFGFMMHWGIYSQWVASSRGRWLRRTPGRGPMT